MSSGALYRSSSRRLSCLSVLNSSYVYSDSGALYRSDARSLGVRRCCLLRCRGAGGGARGVT